MKIYLAARYSRLNELQGYRDHLKRSGAVVTSRWLNGDHQATDEQLVNDPDLANRFRLEDLVDVRKAEVVVCFTEEPRSGPTRGGRHFEAGYAAALGKTIVVVGPVENIFYADPEFLHADSWPEALALLWRLEREQPLPADDGRPGLEVRR